MADQEILQAFIVESLDLLDSLEPKLIELQQACETTGAADNDLINAIFRPFHSMKGGAGMLELNNITSLTHTAETLLDMIRNGERLAESSYTELFFQSMDLVRQMLAAADENGHDGGFEEPVAHLVARLSAAIAEDGGAKAECAKPQEVSADEDKKKSKKKNGKKTPREQAKEERQQAEPAAQSAPEEVKSQNAPVIDLDSFEIPITAEMLAKFVQEGDEQLESFEQSLLSFEAEGKADLITQAFRLIHSFKGNCGLMGFGDLQRLSHRMETVLDYLREHSGASPVDAVSTLLKLIDVLRGGISQAAQGKGGDIAGCDIYLDLLQDILGAWSEQAGRSGQEEAQKKTEAQDNETAVQTQIAPAAQSKGDAGRGRPVGQAEAPAGANSVSRTVVRQDIRVDLRKLDALLNLVGELVIAEAMMTRNPVIAQHEDETVERAVHQLRRVSRDLQDVAMSVRMIPLASTFQRMIRLVHDLSQKSGKKVSLQLQGEETEVDKTVIEQIGDPIVHIVRNAIDHGIESPEERSRANKPDTASLIIEGRHEGGEVWISIRDDGRGLDRAKILAKAIERGLVSGDGSELSDTQVFRLIFEPGFSTAEKVTDISGRGVGMDVVKKNIEKIKGRVDIQSVPGKGASFILRIPLTLAIIEGMLVRVGDGRYIVPLLAIRESVHPEAGQIAYTPNFGSGFSLSSAPSSP